MFCGFRRHFGIVEKEDLAPIIGNTIENRAEVAALVASDNSDSWFEPYHWQTFTHPVCKLNRKHKNRDEEAGLRYSIVNQQLSFTMGQHWRHEWLSI